MAVDLSLNIAFIVGGLVALFFGAEWLVRGAARIALMVGISPLVVGLTVVAFGTSAPELLVCLEANADNQPDVALGNVIGSNICNIGLILGIAAIMRPVVIHKQIVRKEMPILVVVSLLFIGMLHNGMVSRFEGGILFLGVVAYTVVSIIQSRKEESEDDFGELAEEDIVAAKTGGAKEVWTNIFFILLGLAVLKFGSDFLVRGGDYVARYFGVDDAIIALFLFAFGTSLPELATSIVAVRKGEGDLIVGNAIGSCIFNLLAVIGITAMVKPIAEGEIEMLDKLVMLGFTVGIFAFMWSSMKIKRWEGILLCLIYLCYSVVRAQM
ncbi:calcium/sodium antiporter [Rubritalea marina]|uniref:calcium/sodium antiporter n=1 Tax=Rubritalea marina TaxID=361055 RepID=UPI00037394E3|nr:calcium/sodium antiporter [Rubritalea marina]